MIVGWRYTCICAACCRMALVFAIMCLCNTCFFHCFCSFLCLKSSLNLVVINHMEWSTIPACLNLMCIFFFFLTRVILKGLISSKKCAFCLSLSLCLYLSLHILFYFCVGTEFVCLISMDVHCQKWFELCIYLRQLYHPEVTLCGWQDVKIKLLCQYVDFRTKFFTSLLFQLNFFLVQMLYAFSCLSLSNAACIYGGIKHTLLPSQLYCTCSCIYNKTLFDRLLWRHQLTFVCVQWIVTREEVRNQFDTVKHTWWKSSFLFHPIHNFFLVLYVDTWVLPWFALLEWFLWCCTELFHTFLPDQLNRCVTQLKRKTHSNHCSRQLFN